MKQTVTIIKRKARNTGSPVFTIKGAMTYPQRAFVKQLVNTYRYIEHSDCVYFLSCMTGCIGDILAQGHSVKIEELGTFKPTFRQGRLSVNFLPAAELKRTVQSSKIKIKETIVDDLVVAEL